MTTQLDLRLYSRPMLAVLGFVGAYALAGLTALAWRRPLVARSSV
jgi:hypothetical protein